MPFSPEKRKEYNAKRREHNRLYYREWYKKNGRYRSSDYEEAISEWRKNHPEKYKAQILLRSAVKCGRLKKPDGCEKCGRNVRLSGHHNDYSKPLEVIWLCSSCHKVIHKK